MACDTCTLAVVAVFLILSSVKASTQVDVSGLVGNEVRLPCQIDTKTCGTLHSIKWYRGSSRIYVFSDAIRFHKPEGEYATRAHLDYHPNDTTSYLVVKNVNIADEAVYKCEITYLDVIESCLVVQFINLTTLIEPKSIKVTYDTGEEVANGTSVGPLDEGSKLSLTCEVSEGKPIPSLYWYRDNKQTTGVYVPKIGTNAMGSAMNRIDIKVSRNDLGATYVCQSFVQGLNHSMSVHIGIEVNVKPIKMELKGPPMPVRQNITVTLICNVHQAKPAANITWYNGSIALDRRDVDINEEIFPRFDGTVDTKSRLSFTATRYENYKVFKCRAHNPVMRPEEYINFEREIPIEVHYPPIITITPEQITVNETEDVFLSCDYVANPKLKGPGAWYFNGRRITENATQYQVFDNKLVLRKVDRNSYGSYFCSLENNVGVSNSSEAFVNVLYPPTVHVRPESPTVVNETDRTDILLVCEVLFGNPTELVEVRWYFNGRIMENRNKSLMLKEARKSHHGNYSCSGRSVAGLGPISAAIDVKVQYLPGPANLTYYIIDADGQEYQNNVVVKGSTIVLRCSVANLGWPEATQYHWYKGNSEIFGASNGNTLTITSVGIEQKLNNYSCNAANAAGYGENATISIDVHAPPSFINTIKYANASILDQIAEIKCDIECYPECHVSWKKDGILINNSSKEYEILNVRINADQNKNDFSSVSSTLRLIIKEFPNGTLMPNRDDAQYTCESTANDVGPGVESTIDFRVHYPPMNTTIRRNPAAVREGNVPPRITCDSNARPSPTFRWYNTLTNVTVSNEAILDFNRPISRSTESNFTCEASNMYGTSTANFTFDFEYKPSCFVELIEEDDKKILFCKTIANPTKIDYSWFRTSKDEMNLTFNEKTEQLEIDTSNNDEKYVCVANNSVGFSEPCWIDVPASPDWMILRLLKTQHYFIYLAIAIGIIFIVIIICSLIIFICRKRRASEKCANDLSNKNKNSFHSANDALLQPDGDKAFYENLPFHGMQNPPNKPFRPEFSDLNYADVDYRSYGPINYKAASIYAAQKQNDSETESEDYLL